MATTVATRPMERRAYAAPLTTGIFGRRISWAAVIAGVICATFVELLLGSLGGAVGATTVAAATGAAKGAGIGVGIWMVISAIISLYVGGWLAGRMSGAPSKAEGALHGFVTASLATLFVMFLLASAIGGAFGALSNLAGSGLQAANTAAKGTAVAGWGVFVLLLLGCGAAVGGGAVAAPKLHRIEPASVQ